jgi:hypothetical protein
MNQLIVSEKIHFGRGRRTRKEMRLGPEESPQPEAPLRLHRITKLMALAIRFERLVREGTVRDYAELARLGRVTRARITQIMALLQLAPDIQEAILFLPRVPVGKDPITERDLRPIAATADWNVQRTMWRRARVF